MVINASLAATSATAGVVPAFPDFIGDDDQAATTTAKVSATEDATNGVYTKYTHEYVDQAGNVKTVGSTASNFVRYVEYPGERFFKKIKFDVNGAGKAFPIVYP
jgi:hypothetical protein